MKGMETKFIEIPEKYIKNEWWDYRPEEFRYSGHMYYNSPFETCDSCGNCDGARCDYCREIKIPEHYEIAIPSDALEDILKEITDLPDGCVHELVYDDFKSYTIYNNKVYRICWPENKPVEYRICWPENKSVE